MGGFAMLAAPLAVEAQQKVYRIGVMAESASVDPWLQAFREGLRERGYTEGVNIVIEQRNLDGSLDRAPAVAAALIQLKVDVLVVGGAVTVQAARAQTTTIPIVFTTVGDPVRAGLVTSVARPGGNVTGLSNVNPELNSKQLELLKLAVPESSRLAVLHNPGNPLASGTLTRLRETARALSIELDVFEVSLRGELPRVFSALSTRRVGGVLAVSDPVVGSEVVLLAQLASKHRLPAIYARKEFAESGGLLAYGPSFSDIYRRAAAYVDKILRGATPAELPVEQPTKFEFVINLKTAKALGLTIPPSLLLRADQVIE
jgi:putative tryptophan/tyrosine transport system substrate-binding protein